MPRSSAATSESVELNATISSTRRGSPSARTSSGARSSCVMSAIRSETSSMRERLTGGGLESRHRSGPKTSRPESRAASTS